MYEHRSQPLLPRRQFYRRVANHAGVALSLVVVALCVGILGYYWTEHQSLLDALLNASMILSGEGPVNVIHTAAGKVFASFYALFSGVAFLALAGILWAPLVHRLLHRLHLQIPKS